MNTIRYGSMDNGSLLKLSPFTEEKAQTSDGSAYTHFHLLYSLTHTMLHGLHAAMATALGECLS